MTTLLTPRAMAYLTRRQQPDRVLALYPLPPPRSLTLTEMALAYLAARTERPLWPEVR